MSEIKKIGMYTTDEILKHLTEGEGRGFLGRSMYDAIMEKIKQQESQLQQKENVIKEIREYVEKHWACDEKQQVYLYELEDRKELLEILDKGVKYEK